MLQAIGDWIWATQLHYAFRKDVFLFYVMGKTICILFPIIFIMHALYKLTELAPGGEVYEEFDRQKWDVPSHTQRQVLAEIVVAVDQLHNMNIEHRDLKWDNFAIDSHGHVKLIDFGYAMYRDERDFSHPNWFMNMDWFKLGNMCEDLFSQPNPNEANLIAFLRDMDEDEIMSLGKSIMTW